MDTSSEFIENKARFGSFPTQEQVEELELNGVRHFIDLTHSHETKITPYTTKYNYVNFPLPDRSIPPNWGVFACLIKYLSKLIKKLDGDQKVYIHCKGGHGRSGVVVASLVSYMFKYNPSDSLVYTDRCHFQRKIMREKWRTLGSPQTNKQKEFVIRFFSILSFYKPYTRGYTAGFSNFSLHCVNYKNKVFPTAEAAVQAQKNPTDPEYVKRQIDADSPITSKRMGSKTNIRKDWKNVANDIMLQILKCKFEQHPYLKETLLNTGLRPIIQHTRGDSFWGDGPSGEGDNRLGKSLVKLRNIYHQSMIQDFFD